MALNQHELASSSLPANPDKALRGRSLQAASMCLYIHHTVLIHQTQGTFELFLDWWVKLLDATRPL